jgi:hypothetical protein
MNDRTVFKSLALFNRNEMENVNVKWVNVDKSDWMMDESHYIYGTHEFNEMKDPC